MIDPVCPRDGFVVPCVYPFNTAQIDPALRGVRSALMVQVNAASFTKIVFCRVCLPAVQLEIIRAFGDFDARREGSNGGGLTAFAE